MQVCAASVAGSAIPEVNAAGLSARMYKRAKLVDERRQPIRQADLKVGATYVFDYPFSATPCFLLRLDRPAAGGVLLKTETGYDYTWEGGVGPGRDVVAYSAICAHKMTYPTKQVSFIGYRNEPSPVAGKGKVITCCSDRSVYDPAAGARVVAGPAPQPLAAILIEHDAVRNELFALGTVGAEQFDAFFAKYELKLGLEYGGKGRAPVEATSVVRELDQYCRNTIQC